MFQFQRAPRFVPQMTAVRSAGVDRVHVDARYEGHEQHGEASFHADAGERRIEWGAPSGYHGWMKVDPDGDGSRLTLYLDTIHGSEREHDIAASLQQRLEEVAFHVLHHLHQQTGLTDLGLAGGVAYNSVMNGKILLNTPFQRVYVQPADGDSGTALGVCYEIHNGILKGSRGEVMLGAYTGPEFSDDQIRAELEKSELVFETLTDETVTKRAAQDIADGLVVGWFQGRMEFGPRALGNRSNRP